MRQIKGLNSLKYNYNHYLKRYYNGCKYCEEHIDETEKWLPELLDIMENINVLLEEIKKYEKVNTEDILGGFKI